jgi:serine/threonine-protein kinase
MTVNVLPAWKGGCLNREMLAAYNLGRIPAALLDSVAEHLSQCKHCESTLQLLQGEKDTLLRNLEQYLSGASLSAGEDDSAVSNDCAGTQPLPGAVAGLGPLPRRFGQYEILEKLGKGGMYKARQLRPNRLVALKIPLYAPLPGTESFERFQIESQAIARLQHENIVRIYECGEQDGFPYFSMEYMEAGSLAKALSESPLPQRQAAQLVLTLAQAVHFAHEQGVLHRDLKPANVLLGANGAVKLTDFGLAKLQDVDDGQTKSDAILGTAKYMSPEQARGGSKHVGRPADVYGLGAILYEALTGRPPFQGDTHRDILDLVESQLPVPPSRLRPGISRALEAICLKCLEKPPGKRYASAEKLAEDLRCWMERKPTQARPPRWPTRLYRGARRHAIALSIGIVLLVGSVSLYWLDADRPIKAILRDLSRGQPVTLIGETGKPLWFRVRVGEESTQVSLAGDGTFSVHSWALCLLELVPDPQHRHYCVQGDICHKESDLVGEVGIYLAHSAHPGPQAEIQAFAQLSFNDVRSIFDRYNRIPPNFPKPPPPKGNPVSLSPHIYSAGREGEMCNQQAGLGGIAGAYFKAAGVGGGPWHQFQLIVTPENVRGFWDDQLVGDLPVPVVIEHMNRTLAQLCPADPSVQHVPPERWLRGSLGLYVQRGSAQFRSVNIRPLTKAD